jgi:hypothetical protein
METFYAWLPLALVAGVSLVTISWLLAYVKKTG